jgi:hypothetical protein
MTPKTTLRPWIKACVTREFHAISNGCWRLEWASKKIKQIKTFNREKKKKNDFFKSIIIIILIQ